MVMAGRKARYWLIALAAAGFAATVLVYLNRDTAPRQGGRYDEIADLIQDNLKFSRHFTWAVNTETIRAVKARINPGDLTVLARLLDDERGTVTVAAAALLVLLGAPGETILKRAAASPNTRKSIRALDALMHLAQCRNPKVTNLDRTMCPAR
jgi:hypothetical protein